MDIGSPKRQFTVEPARDPVPVKRPAGKPDRDRMPAEPRPPERVPQR